MKGKKRRNILIVMMTGQHPVEKQQNNVLKMTCGILRKPFGIKELLTMIYRPAT